MSMRSPSAPIGHGTVAPSEDVPVVGAAVPDFSGESLRHIPVAIYNYLGCFSPDLYAFMAASKMAHSWYNTTDRFDQ